MRAVLLKDILNLKQQAKIYIIIIAVWAAVSFINKDAVFFCALTMLISIMFPMTAVGYDEKSKWEPYALTMPITRAQAALSKYILAFIASVFIFIISFAASVLITHNPAYSFALSAVFLLAGMTGVSVILPIVYKFGVEKGRVVMMIILLLPVLLRFLLQKIGLSFLSISILQNNTFLIYMACIVLICISMIVSVNIYKHKQF